MADVTATPADSRTTPALELCNVHLHRDGTDVIGSISVRVEQNQRWVVLGANGSGKTSLMRIMALYDHPIAALEPWWHQYDDADAERAGACLERVGVGQHAHRIFGSLSRANNSWGRSANSPSTRLLRHS